MSLDIKLFYFFADLGGTSKLGDAFTVFFAEYLEYFLVIAFLFLVYFSAYSRREKLSLLLVTATSAAIARGVITEIIRFFYHRPRPFLTHPFEPLLSESSWSFPSGHATFFFAMAAAIYFYNKKWGAWFFIASLVMTISRVVAAVHYPSDILGGMIIGIIVAYVVYYIERKKMA